MLSPEKQRLLRICDYCELVASTIERFGATYDAFIADIDYQQSISFSILQIGELVANLPEPLKSSTSSRINWSQIKGMRNVIAHHYGKIDYEILWNAAVVDIPALKTFCEALIQA